MKRTNIVYICVLILLSVLLLACEADGEPNAPVSEPAPTAAPTAVPAKAPDAQDDEVVIVTTPAPTERPKVNSLHIETPTEAQTVIDRIMAEGTVETVEIDPGMLSNEGIAALINRFPDISFRYEVRFGDTFISSDTETLSTADASIAEILSAAPCLKRLSTVDLGVCAPEEIETVRTAIPNAELRYSLVMYGREVACDTETLDLSDLDALLPDGLKAALPYLPALRTVVLGTREDEGILELFQAADLPLAYDCVYRVSYLGQTLMSDAETLDLSGKKITDAGELRTVIAKLPKLKQVDMIGCGLDNAAMAAICDAFPDVKFVWEINLGDWGKLRTDATAFSTRYNKKTCSNKRRLKDDTVQYIRYCTDLVALDLGHQQITDISFLRPLKNLRVLILADNYISDIGVLAELKELEYIELFMNRVSDLRPLAGLEHLVDLNICSNKVSDFSPLYGLKTLRRFWYARNDYKKLDHEKLKEALPDCELNYTVRDATGDGWRSYKDGTKSEREKWKNAFFEGAPRYE